MCNFGAWEEWRIRRIYDIYYLDVDTIKDQDRLINSKYLDYIKVYIMEDYVGYKSLNKIPNQRMNLVDVSI